MSSQINTGQPTESQSPFGLAIGDHRQNPGPSLPLKLADKLSPQIWADVIQVAKRISPSKKLSYPKIHSRRNLGLPHGITVAKHDQVIHHIRPCQHPLKGRMEQKTIGRGQFSKVREALLWNLSCPSESRLVVRKKPRKFKNNSRVQREAFESIFREAAFYQALQDEPGFARLAVNEVIISASGTPHLVLERYDGDLSSLMANRSFFLIPPQARKDIALQVARALVRMQARGWYHLDIKSDNILFNAPSAQSERYEVFIADPGRAVQRSAVSSSFLKDAYGDPQSSPPEGLAGAKGHKAALDELMNRGGSQEAGVSLNRSYLEKADVYGLGILLFQMSHQGAKPAWIKARRSKPAFNPDVIESLYRLEKEAIFLHQEDQSPLQQLISSMLAFEMKDRPDMREVLARLEALDPKTFDPRNNYERNCYFSKVQPRLVGYIEEGCSES